MAAWYKTGFATGSIVASQINLATLVPILGEIFGRGGERTAFRTASGRGPEFERYFRDATLAMSLRGKV
jgi:hypothetical protein